MTNDRYLRVVLTVIAGALVYLCAVLTPLPVLQAGSQQVVGARTPGESTGPAQVVIVGWRVPPDQALPVQVLNRVTVSGEVGVTGRVETRQQPNAYDRVVLAGWEPARDRGPGVYSAFGDQPRRGVPVNVLPNQP